MRTLILIFLLVIICTSCQENNHQKEEKIDTENYPLNRDDNSINFEFIKQQSVKIKAFSSEEINRLRLKKVPKEFINKYLQNCKLPIKQEIDEIHQFDYYFLNCKQTDKYFSFTFLSKSETIESASIYLFTADLVKGHLQDCAAIAEYFDYEGSVILFEANLKDANIVINQTESGHNVDGNLETTKQKVICTVNNEHTIIKDRKEKVSFIGKEDALFLEYDNHFKLTIPGFNYPNNLSKENPMYRSVQDLRIKDTTTFEIWDFDGISGSLAGNKLVFDLNQDNIIINSIKMAVATGIYFNEDGSGGVWQEGGSGRSNWFQLTKINQSEYAIPNPEELLKKVSINEEHLTEAKNTVNTDNRLSYTIDFSYHIIELEYLAYGKLYKKYIEFEFTYGD